LPVNLPLEHRTFSDEYSEHWFGLIEAHARFMVAVTDYCDGARSGSLGKWKLLRRRFAALGRSMQDCDAFVGKLGGDSVPPVYKSDHDRGECYAMTYFLTDRAMPFAEFWQGVINAIDDGTPLTINASDIPKWLDVEAT
jgi:hypothetical protein